MDKDYYQILGIVRTAAAADIDAAYRALARRFHPDLGPSTPDSLARLKLINEAYGILSDRQKRSAYDRQHRPLHADARVPPRECRGTHDLEVELPIAPEEALHGGPCDLTVTTWIACRDCSGRGRTVETPCKGCNGHGKMRQQRSFSIELPRGLSTGEIVRIALPSKQAAWGNGDLLLRIEVRPCW